MEIGSIIIYGIAGLLFIILVAIGIFVYFKKKGGAKHPFILYSLDGTRMRIIEGFVRKDPENPHNTRFFFKELDASLEIRPPTTWLNNVAHREIIYNDLGEVSYIKNNGIKIDEAYDNKKNREQQKDGSFQYVTKTVIDKKAYKDLAIEPEEKALALHRYKETLKQYENPLSKAQAYMLIGGFILVIIIMVGIIYSTVSYVKASESQLKMVDKIAEITVNNKDMTNVNKQIVEQLTAIAAALTGDMNLTRQIS